MPMVITITFTEDGRFSCSGPLENKMLCYGMLELARDAVANHKPSPIVRPDGQMPPPPGRN